MLKIEKIMLVFALSTCLTIGNSIAQTSAAGQKATSSAVGSTQAPKTIVETAMANPEFSTLVSAIKAADLVETLSGTGPFTVFAPSNAAFKALPAGALEELLKPENKAKLQELLTNHVLSGKMVKSTDLKDGQSVKSIGGQALNVSLTGGKATINGSNVSQADVEASNGVIHVIDKVILSDDVDANK
jgi:uncharacterized surface protein with fasciclin (FAS1) repeats